MAAWYTFHSKVAFEVRRWRHALEFTLLVGLLIRAARVVASMTTSEGPGKEGLALRRLLS